MAVGELVVHWAVVESAIVKIVAIVYQSAGGNQISPDKLPMAFKRQRKFLRRCGREIADLASFENEISEVLDKAAALSVLRNAVIHGAVSAYNPATRSYTFVKLDVDDRDNMHEINEVTADLASLEIAAETALRLQRQALNLVGRLMDAFVR